jgi:predicted flap endonuclease-1-like 5' DNA nuclease
MNWLSFFIGALVGWLIELIIDFVFWRRRYQGSASEARLRIELAGLEAKASQLEAQLVGCQEMREQYTARATELQACTAALQQAQDRLAAMENEIAGLHTAPASMETAVHEPEVSLPDVQAEVAERAAPVIAATTVVPDDLRKIEGIGPKIAGILNEQGIQTFAQLAETDVVRLRQILKDAGPRYTLADPETWPEQARLAAMGDLRSLKSFQGRLKGGRKKPQ